jgi:coenzyme F420-reducing hydrogenase delta subunit
MKFWVIGFVISFVAILAYRVLSGERTVFSPSATIDSTLYHAGYKAANEKWEKRIDLVKDTLMKMQFKGLSDRASLRELGSHEHQKLMAKELYEIIKLVNNIPNR